MKKLKVGDKVEWTSQSNGRSKRKIGNVVMVLGSNDSPLRIAENVFPDHRRMFDGPSIPPGYGKAYLIEVRDGKTSKPKLYMPYPKHLRLCEKE